jgi:hypothetical protein
MSMLCNHVKDAVCGESDSGRSTVTVAFSRSSDGVSLRYVTTATVPSAPTASLWRATSSGSVTRGSASGRSGAAVISGECEQVVHRPLVVGMTPVLGETVLRGLGV